MSKLQNMNLKPKYQQIWELSLPKLKKCRQGDVAHAKDTVEFIQNYDGKIELDREILIPVAIMHDIGHSALLPRHFKYVTGPDKLKNGKLVHMLTGAKIAKDILEQVDYAEKKRTEIVDIISMHDFDRIEEVENEKVYNSDNKKIFNDIDSLDRYTKSRVENLLEHYGKEKLFSKLESMLDLFFYDEFRSGAESNLQKIKSEYDFN